MSISAIRYRTGRHLTRPRAPEGAPNVVYIVLDDVGFLGHEQLWRSYRDAEHRPDRHRRAALHPVAHDRFVLADAFVPADWP